MILTGNDKYLKASNEEIRKIEFEIKPTQEKLSNLFGYYNNFGY